MTTPLPIREATAADSQAIMAVIQDVFTEYGFIFEAATETPDLLTFNTHYDQTAGAFFVYEPEETITGTVGIKLLDENTAELYRLYLRATRRGSGIGRRLLDTALNWAREQGVAKVILWSDTRFTLSHKLYLKAGFVQSGWRDVADINATVEYQFSLML